jgi:uncharacterized protein (TIGR02996 family)
MTSTERNLLAAVLAEPDDDTPRLIFADWCEDNGEPGRAAFIRTQIAIARGEGDEIDCNKCGGHGIYSVMSKDSSRRIGSQISLRGTVKKTVYRQNEYEDALCQKCKASGKLISQVALRRREQSLLRPSNGLGSLENSHPRLQWIGELVEVFRHEDFRYSWRRGFVEEITCTARLWLAHADAILAAQPVREVRLTTFGRVLSQKALRLRVKICIELLAQKTGI